MAGHRLTPVIPAMHSFMSDPDYARLKALIIRRTGHHYYEDKDELLGERLRRRLHGLGLASCAEYQALLGNATRGEAEWSALEAEITIGETFFFRYVEQFAALREEILPRLIARNQSSRRLRVWSAGCANGAEPYSLAILLRQILGDALPDWRIHLIGSDINEAVLEVARRAEFGNWALRSLTAEELARDFIPGAAGGIWLLRPQHRAMVRFARHNLLSLLDGSSPLQFNEFDLILCRNVLIYFHPEMVQRIVRALSERLAPGGWLLLGHAEPSPVFQDFLEVVQLQGTVAYRRPLRPLPLPGRPGPWQPASWPPASWQPGLSDLLVAGPGPAGAASRPIPAFPRPELRRGASSSGLSSHGVTTHGPSSGGLSSPAVLAESRPPPVSRAEVRGLADQGDLLGARQACREGLLANPVDAGLHFYDAMVARALAEPTQAEQGFRRALYLNGGFVMAHYQLGLLLLDQGQREAGRRSLANALRIAQGLPEGRALEEGDGMTARELRDSVRLQLEASAMPPPRR